MRERDMKIVFGKVRYVPVLFFKDLKEALNAVIRSKIEFEHRGNFWVFGDIVTNEQVIGGRLGKYKKEEQRYVYDKDKRVFAEEGVERGTAKFSNFIISLDNSIIVFEDRYPIIAPNSFISVFTKVSEKCLQGGKIEIIPFVETEEIMKILRTFDMVSRARFSVTPANPADDAQFKRLQEILKETKSKKGGFEFENPEDGLKVEDTIIEEGIALSGKGYGEFKLTGERQGEKVIISSKDKILETLLKSVPDEIKKIVILFLKEIKKRFGG